MDLSLLGRALWRQRWIVLLGVLLGVAAAVFSAYRIEDGRLVERTENTYESNVRLLVTALPEYQSSAIRNTETGQQIIHGLQISQLAGTYPYLILSDQVMDKVRAQIGSPSDSYEIDAFRRTVAPNVNQNATLTGDNTLPVVELRAAANSPALAQQAVSVTATTFIDLIVSQQNAAKLPAEQRVQVTQLGNASDAVQIGRSPLVLQFVVFVGILMVFIALGLARQNAQVVRRARKRTSVGPDKVSSSSSAEKKEVEEIDIRIPTHS